MQQFKPRRVEAKMWSIGNLEVSGEQYSINDQFQQDSLKLADELNLDELDAARLYLDAQDETESTGRPALTNSLIRFHQRRKYTLDCLRLILQQASDVRGDEPEQEAIREDMRSLVTQITQPQNGVRYASKCLSAMEGIKAWLRSLAEKVNSASVLGQAPQSETVEAIEYQRVSLIKQHECLGIILLYLVKDNASNVEDFELVLESMKKADKYDSILGRLFLFKVIPFIHGWYMFIVHYLPALSAYVSRFGGDNIGTIGEARALHNKIFNRSANENSWGLKYVQAAFQTWWLAEYSSWYGDNHDGSLSDAQLDEGKFPTITLLIRLMRYS
jgi:nuclear pore complex protein Nup205